MTTAARPTFDPAKGKESIVLSHQASSKDQPGHTKLKVRQPGQGGEDEYTIEDLKEELREAERRHFKSKKQDKTIEMSEELEDEKTKYIEMAQRLDAESDVSDSDRDSASDTNDSESDDDSDDETAMLMRELEKIKRERAAEKEKEKEQETMQDSGSLFLGQNPLLSNQDFSVKRRWDDDVVFKNQARIDDKPQKRFVNDMLRSDFHRKFMRKYIH